MAGNLLGELQRRNVIRMAGLYLVGAWLLVQVAATLLPVFEAPPWLMRTLVIALVVLFVPALAFAWVFELTPQGLRRDADLAPGQSLAPRTARRMDRAISVVLLLALGYFALDKFALAPRREAALVAQATSAAKATAAPVVPIAQEQSIAVLPFVNLSADPEQAYFSDGLAEDLITALSQFAGLKVIGRSSSFRFRDSKDDPRSIGVQLGVVHLLTGSVRRAGDQVRISADLVNVADGRTLWSQRYDRAYTDLFKLQDEITAAVAEALKARLLAGQGANAQGDRPPSGNLEAYNAYLQGRFYTARNTPADFVRAIDFLGQAVALDPGYARAHAALAIALSRSAAIYESGTAQAREKYRRAKQQIALALRLAPDQAFVHIANSALLATADLDWTQAEAESRRSLELAPNDVEAMAIHAENLAILGHVEESVALARRVYERDPLNAVNWYWLGHGLMSLGRFDEAEQAAQRAFELQPDSTPGGALVAYVQSVRGNHSAAVAAAKRIAPGVWHDIALAISTQQAGDRPAADAALDKLVADQSTGAAYQIAEAYAQRGEPDKVFEWLERAWVSRDSGLRRLLPDPFIAPYRGDPRFAAFCRKIGLPPPDPQR